MGLIAYLVVTVVGGAAVFIFPPLVPFIAGLLGFTSTGVVAGSIAASAQSYLGYVSAGSIFSVLQAAAALAPTP